ncbi:4-phosphoerythronate dehydrogenase [Microbulbifer aggregans]|uniref:4-phosphoerythronate dehydrogenase n=1 Tax=Microbulbifer aggregans TaxID=1769779 RepID=UPI001CFD25E4|nr:4-phosphoerythronate dehydrogenase [Microbulbifer aggregans]
MSERKFQIVADENIPGLDAWFGDLGEITRVPGRGLAREQLAQADILLVRSVTEVNEALLANTPVRFVGSCTIGIDHLDTGWLEQQGIAWSAAPGCNANSVVEYVFCALAALNVDWRERRFGIVGCGNVGGLLQRRLHQLEIPAAVYDPWLPDNPDAADLSTVLQQDVVCLHAPLVKNGPYPSFHMIGEEELVRLKPGAVLISAGRGAVIDNAALGRVITQRPDLTVVLDVWEHEPDIDVQLLPQVALGSPHIAGYSHDGKLAGTRMIRHALDTALELPAAGSSSDKGTTGDQTALSTVESGFSAIRDLLLKMYDPRDDDQRLRSAAKQSARMSESFDLLRKRYPKRLEFSHFRVEAPQLDVDIRNQLAILGLK